MSEGGKYIFYGIAGEHDIFNFTYCENERLWRRMLGVTPERYQKTVEMQFDECHNAFMKPHSPVYCEILNNLHKKSDYE